MSDRQQNGLLMGWAPMVARLMLTPSELAWGQCLLAHMFSEMHKILYQESKSFTSSALVL